MSFFRHTTKSFLSFSSAAKHGEFNPGMNQPHEMGHKSEYMIYIVFRHVHWYASVRQKMEDDAFMFLPWVFENYQHKSLEPFILNSYLLEGNDASNCLK